MPAPSHRRHIRLFSSAANTPDKASISPRIELPVNFDNRIIELERNTLTFSCVV